DALPIFTARPALGDPGGDGGQLGRVVVAQDVDKRVGNSDLVGGITSGATRGNDAPRQPRGVIVLAGGDGVTDVTVEEARRPSAREALGRAVDTTDACLGGGIAAEAFLGAVEGVATIVDGNAAGPA